MVEYASMKINSILCSALALTAAFAAAFSCTGGALAEPVWVDLLTGRVYEFPKKDMLAHSCGVTYLDVPVYDSPCVLTERRVALPQTIFSRATISRR